MIIPFEQLRPDTLRNLIAEFVTREGTDSGYARGSLAENVDRVLGYLRRGEAVLVYDASLAQCNIVNAQQLKKQRPDLF